MAAWFYGVYEFISMHRLSPFVFRTGRVVFAESRVVLLDPSRVALNAVQTTENGKFKFITPQECLFCQQFRLFNFRLHTPFPLKCTVRWRDGLAQVEGRIPVGPTVFLAAWLCGWTLGGLGVAVKEGVGIAALGFTVIGLAFAAGMYFVSVPLEIRRARGILREMELPNKALEATRQ